MFAAHCKLREGYKVFERYVSVTSFMATPKQHISSYCFLSKQTFEGHEEEKMGSVVSGAVITSNGKLTDKFKYIADLRETNMANGHANVNGDFKSDKKVGTISLTKV